MLGQLLIDAPVYNFKAETTHGSMTPWVVRTAASCNINVSESW